MKKTTENENRIPCNLRMDPGLFAALDELFNFNQEKTAVTERALRKFINSDDLREDLIRQKN